MGDHPTNPGPGVREKGWQLGKTLGCRLLLAQVAACIHAWARGLDCATVRPCVLPMPFKQKEILVKAEQKLSGKDVKKLSAEASRRSKPVQTSTHAATRACRVGRTTE